MHGGARGDQRRYLRVGPVRFEIFFTPAGESGWIMGAGIAGIAPRRRLAWEPEEGGRERGGAERSYRERAERKRKSCTSSVRSVSSGAMADGALGTRESSSWWAMVNFLSFMKSKLDYCRSQESLQWMSSAGFDRHGLPCSWYVPICIQLGG